MIFSSSYGHSDHNPTFTNKGASSPCEQRKAPYLPDKQ